MENPPAAELASSYRVVPATYKPTRKHLRGDEEIDWPYLTWCLMGTAFYFVCSPLILNLSAFVPNFDTGSEMYE